MEKYVSVIIPVYKDWYRLALCVNALSLQSYGYQNFEIIIVNNCPDDEVPVGFYIPQNCFVIKEAKPGSYAARNTGIKAATGEILAFTDSDCIPDSNWIRNAVTAFHNNPKYSRIAGRIKLYYTSDSLNRAELYEKVYAFNQDIYVKRDGTGVTANLFTYSNVVATVGPFNDSLMSGGDYEWSVRANKAGFGIMYGEDIVVRHPARNDMAELISKAKRVGGGQAGFAANSKKSRLQSVIKFIYDLRPPVKSLVLVISKGKDLRLMQKLNICYTRYYLTVITAYEKLKINLGRGTAQRT
ncbi:MAG: glycosyltransferase family 2 protein [Sphingobacteriaceae bacterium]|nr:MAG: glycosyltransferase family 2 protein [Sphingobacteriaceae bacterium]